MKITTILVFLSVIWLVSCASSFVYKIEVDPLFNNCEGVTFSDLRNQEQKTFKKAKSIPALQYGDKSFSSSHIDFLKSELCEFFQEPTHVEILNCEFYYYFPFMDALGRSAAMGGAIGISYSGASSNDSDWLISRIGIKIEDKEYHVVIIEERTYDDHSTMKQLKDSFFERVISEAVESLKGKIERQEYGKESSELLEYLIPHLKSAALDG